MQIARSVFIAVVGIIFIAAFFVGVEFIDNSNHRPTGSLTETITSSYVVTERVGYQNLTIVKEVIIEPVFVDEVCLIYSINSTFTSTSFSTTNNSENTFYVTLSSATTSFVSTSTLYMNVTMISGSSTCEVFNSHYNVTTTNGKCSCV
jgi:hypothetical protein